MRKLSSWARHHRHAARIIIIVGHLVLGLLAFYLSRLLQVELSPSLAYTAVILFLITCLVYPSRQTRTRLRKSVAYRWQKTCDFILLVLAFFMTFSIAGSSFFSRLSPGQFVYGATMPAMQDKKPGAEEILASLAYRDKHSLTRSEKRILKKEFRNQLKLYTKAKLQGHKEEADKALLIILTIVAAVGLFALLAALTCSIACSGAEGAAIALLILGSAAIVLGVVLVINSISKRPKKEKVNSTTFNH
jgi:small-conductance mechanosensitive channel